jgi:hypothetical protein
VDLKDTEDTRDTLETKIEVLVDGYFIRKRNRESTLGWSIFPIFIFMLYAIDGGFICLLVPRYSPPLNTVRKILGTGVSNDMWSPSMG